VQPPGKQKSMFSFSLKSQFGNEVMKNIV